MDINMDLINSKLTPETCLIPTIIEHRAQETPNRVFALLPKGPTLRDGWFELTYSALAKAVDRMAWWLHDTLDTAAAAATEEQKENTKSLTYVGANDIRYVFLTYAAVKSRRKLLIPFPANTVQGMSKLLAAADCRIALASGKGCEVWGKIQKVKPELRIVEIPEMEFFLREGEGEVFPYEVGLDEGRKDMLFMLQTSGSFFECSIIHACFFFVEQQTLTHYNLFEFFLFFFLGTTGDPKPILYLHQFLEIFLENRLANELLLNNNSSSSPPSQQLLCFAHLNQDIYFPCMFPISWSAALTSCTLSSLAWDVTCIYLPPDAPFDSHPMLTPEYVHDILELTPKGPKNGIIMAPAMLRDVVQQHQQQNSSASPSSSATCTSSSLDLLQKSYNWIGYGGSPLDFATGEILRKSFSSSSSPIRLQCAMGQTDVGPYDILFNPNPADWNLVQFSELHGYFLVEFDQREGLWELCVRRQQKQKGGKGKEECRHPFLMDEKLEVYHTRDLFRAVRRKKGGGEEEGGGEKEDIYWQSAGRVDDFIKLSTLTKFHSGQIESILETWCEEVQTCLVGGEGKIRPWVIVELRKSKKENEKENGNGMSTSPPESFWLAVDKANEILYSEAKIQREFVVFTDEERPIQRTGKGSVDRKKTVGLYEREIEALYE